MHDPMTVAFDIGPVTIWHVDPETDGTDDSCGWFQPNLSKKDLAIIDDIVEWEEEFPFYSSQSIPNRSDVQSLKYSYLQQSPGDCLGYVAAAWMRFSWKKSRAQELTVGELSDVFNLAVNPNDSLRAILSDPEEHPRDRARRFLSCVMRQFLRHHRPWYRHPKWHIHHWEIQVHPIQNLKRWLFSRCARCGKRFAWRYSPTSTQWGGTGPRWFRSEEHCYHRRCLGEGQQVKKDE